jgi:hypothetical protein
VGRSGRDDCVCADGGGVVGGHMDRGKIFCTFLRVGIGPENAQSFLSFCRSLYALALMFPPKLTHYFSGVSMELSLLSFLGPGARHGGRLGADDSDGVDGSRHRGTSVPVAGV